MNKFTVAAGAAILAMSATALFAAPGDTAGKAGGRMGAKMDTDGNGSITRAEAQAAANAGWTRLDANADGKLDPADRTARRAAMFDRIDADSNGAISRAEFDAQKQGRDGMKRAGREGGKMGGRMGRGGRGHGGRGHGGMGGHGMMAMGRMADTNGDGAVSRAEFDAGVAKAFAMTDANSDGTITPAERQTAREKMRAAWKAQRAAPAPTN